MCCCPCVITRHFSRKMKWIFVVTLFLYPIAALEENICGEKSYNVCNNPLNSLEDLRQAEDVINNCPKFKNYIACLGNYDETCKDVTPYKVFKMEGEFESVRDMVADICDKNTLLHTVLVKQVQCISESIFSDDNNTCYTDGIDLDRSLFDASSDDDSEFYDSFIESCFTILYRSTCLLEYVNNNCGGIMTKDAVIEVLQRSYFLRNVCEPGAALELSGVMDKIEIRNPLKDTLKELLQRSLKKEK